MNWEINRATHGSAELGAGWSEKEKPYRPVAKRRRRSRLHKALFAAGCVVGLGGVALLAALTKWRDHRVAEFERQRAALHAFLGGAEFAEFARAIDRQFVAMNNYIAARPRDARSVLGPLAAGDDVETRVPWTTELMPLPVSAATEPQRVLRVNREIGAALARRGFVFDERSRHAGRHFFLQLLAAHHRSGGQRASEHDFPAIAFDRTMQEAALAAFAARHGPGAGINDAERLFALYAKFRPAMWTAIEQERLADERRRLAAADTLR